MHGMGMHGGVVHDVGMHDMAVHDVTVHNMGMPVPGVDVHKMLTFFSSKKLTFNVHFREKNHFSLLYVTE
jgi:hypothetical protein